LYGEILGNLTTTDSWLSWTTAASHVPITMVLILELIESLSDDAPGNFPGLFHLKRL
jgi:hypothetical protein